MKIKIDIAKQNTPEAIQLLSAQKNLYSQAKFIELFSLLSTLVPIILVLFIGNGICIQFITTIATVISLLLTQWSKNEIKSAARIREKFDTHIFGLYWNKILVGREPSPEIINKFSKNQDQSILKNWYTNPDLDSDGLNIIICQRNNVVWNI
ncbi:MAG: S-4TM family putative pore-forming effector, partial [Oenococcus oeni]